MSEESFSSRLKLALLRPEGRFFAVLIVGIAALFLALLLGAFLIDPHEDFGTGIIDPIVLTNRSEKIEMIQSLDEHPEILIFGSSRTFTVDPDYIFNLTGKRAFNASVSYGRSEDHHALLRYLVEHTDIRPKHIVVGFNAGAFNNDPIDTQLMNNKYLKRYLAEAPTPLYQRAPRILKTKLNASYVRDMIRGLVFNAKGFPEDRVSFLPHGMQDTIDTAYDAQKIDLNYYRALALFEHLEEPNWDRLEAFRSFIHLALEEDIRVSVVLLPMPDVTRERLLEETALSDIEARLQTFFTDEMPKMVTFYDFSEVDSFGGLSEGFNDPTHPNIANTRLITEAIFK